MYKAMASDVNEMASNMVFTFGNVSVSEADNDDFVCLDVNTAVYVFDIFQLKRLRRPVIVAFDVHLDGIGFSFDVVTGFDAFECDVLHCLPSVVATAPLLSGLNYADLLMALSTVGLFNHNR
jgi:hypothetical protein